MYSLKTTCICTVCFDCTYFSLPPSNLPYDTPICFPHDFMSSSSSSLSSSSPWVQIVQTIHEWLWSYLLGNRQLTSDHIPREKVALLPPSTANSSSIACVCGVVVVAAAGGSGGGGGGGLSALPPMLGFWLDGTWAGLIQATPTAVNWCVN